MHRVGLLISDYFQVLGLSTLSIFAPIRLRENLSMIARFILKGVDPFYLRTASASTANRLMRTRPLIPGLSPEC